MVAGLGAKVGSGVGLLCTKVRLVRKRVVQPVYLRMLRAMRVEAQNAAGSWALRRANRCRGSDRNGLLAAIEETFLNENTKAEILQNAPEHQT